MKGLGRKNNRRKNEYRDRLGFNPKKYIRPHHESQQDQSEGQMPDDRNKHHEHHPYPMPHRGEIWFADLGSHHGTSVQDGCRPVLVISNDKGNHYATTIVVLPMTRKMKKYDLPSHVELHEEDLVMADLNRQIEPSMVLAEQVTTIAKSALRSYVGKIQSGQKLTEIDQAICAQLGIMHSEEDRKERVYEHKKSQFCEHPAGAEGERVLLPVEI